MNELARLKAGLLSYHHSEKGIAGNIEGNTEPNIAGPLVKHAAQPIPVYKELEEDMAGREGHVRDILNVPG